MNNNQLLHVRHKHTHTHTLNLNVNIQRGSPMCNCTATVYQSLHALLTWRRENATQSKSEDTTQSSQPFSLTMCVSSMIYLPSLYFCVDSNACSYAQEQYLIIRMLRMLTNKYACKYVVMHVCSFEVYRSYQFIQQGPDELRKLTYFQPSVVLQPSQQMSATACRPVNRIRSSAGPQPTLTLRTTVHKSE